MDKNNLLRLLEDQSFLNYCQGSDQKDVQHWENWLLSHPEEVTAVQEIKVLVILLTEEAKEQQAEAGFNRLSQRLSPEVKPAIVKKIRFMYTRVAAAAMLVLALSAGLYFYFAKSNAPVRYTISKSGDIKPGGNKAILTLANGTKIDLTSASNGVLAVQNGSRIAKSANGQVTYQVVPKVNEEIHAAAINTIETPVKGQYMIILPDGTKVWLNAVSSLRYPASFDKNIREVELKGEAYFEVAHITAKGSHKRVPFIVRTSSANQEKAQRIEVLGTHFNVNSYNDEPLTKTTLLAGSVKVSSPRVLGNREALLSPGQEISSGTGQFKVGQADVAAAIAWKNGDFMFREDIRSALRKVARWYDVDIVYAPSAPEHLMLGGWISRKKNISEVLEMMEGTGKVHFTVTGRRIMVTE